MFQPWGGVRKKLGLLTSGVAKPRPGLGIRNFILLIPWNANYLLTIRHERSRTNANVLRQVAARCKVFIILYIVIYSIQHYFHEIAFLILFVFILVISEPFESELHSGRNFKPRIEILSHLGIPGPRPAKSPPIFSPLKRPHY